MKKGLSRNCTGLPNDDDRHEQHSMKFGFMLAATGDPPECRRFPEGFSNNNRTGIINQDTDIIKTFIAAWSSALSIDYKVSRYDTG